MYFSLKNFPIKNLTTLGRVQELNSLYFSVNDELSIVVDAMITENNVYELHQISYQVYKHDLSSLGKTKR